MNVTVIQIEKGDSILVDGNWHKIEKKRRKENHKTWGDVIFFNDLHPIFTFISIPCQRALVKNIKNGECQPSLKEPRNRLD